MIKRKSNKIKPSISLVEPGDSVAIYKISNQNFVRENSFEQRKIDFKEHQKWFKNKLADKNVLMLKAVANDKIAGQVKLDIKGNRSLIGVSVLKDFQGTGIGSALLQAAQEKAKEINLIAIDAYIKPGNIASVKLFEKYGWVFDKETKVGRNKAIKYIYVLKRKPHEI